MADAWKIGNFATDSMTGRVIIMLQNVAQYTLNNGAGAALTRAGAAYTVTAGKTLHLQSYFFTASAAFSANAAYELRYGDDAALTTNPVTLCSLMRPSAALALTVTPFPLGDVQVPAGKYVGVFNNSGTNEAASASYYNFIGFEA